MPMLTWIALLRGVNVGGRGSLPMAELRVLIGEAGGRDVRTYIQSGNAVFAADEANEADRGALAARIAGAVEEAKGFRPAVMLLSAGELAHAMAANPFPRATDAPTSLHLCFPERDPGAVTLDTLEAARGEDERYALVGGVLYLWCPSGIGRSKLAAGVERAVGVPVTARNWRTVARLHAMAGGKEAEM